MPGVIQLPDVLAAALDYLANRAEVQAVFGDPARLASELEPGAGLPFGQLTDVTDAPLSDPPWLWAVSLRADVWAEDTETARDGAALIRAVLQDDDPVTGFVGLHAVPAPLVVTAVEPGLGLRPFRDPDTDQPRYQVGVQVVAHPAPA